MKYIKKTRTARKSFIERKEDFERIDSLAETELLEKDEMYHQNYQSHEQHHQISYQNHYHGQNHGTHFVEHQHKEYGQYSSHYRPYSVHDSRQRSIYKDKEYRNDPCNLDYYMAPRDDPERGNSENRRKSSSPHRSTDDNRREYGRGSSSHRRYSDNSRRTYRSSGYYRCKSPRNNTSGYSPRKTSRGRIREDRSRSNSSSSSTRSASVSSVTSDSSARISPDKRKVRFLDRKQSRSCVSKGPKSIISKVYGKKFMDSFSSGYNRRHIKSVTEETKVEVTIGDLTMSPISSDDLSQHSEKTESEVEKEEIVDKKLYSTVKIDAVSVNDTKYKKATDLLLINTSKNVTKKDENDIGNKKEIRLNDNDQKQKNVISEHEKKRFENDTYERSRSFKSNRKTFEKEQRDTRSNVTKNRNELKHSDEMTKVLTTGNAFETSDICADSPNLTEPENQRLMSFSIQASKCDISKESNNNKDYKEDMKVGINETSIKPKNKGSFQELKKTLLQTSMDCEMVDKIVMFMANKSKSSKELESEQNCSEGSKRLEKLGRARSAESHVVKSSLGSKDGSSSKVENCIKENRINEIKGHKDHVQNEHSHEKISIENKKPSRERGTEMKNKEMTKHSESRIPKIDTNQKYIDDHPLTKSDSFTDQKMQEHTQKVKVKNTNQKLFVEKSQAQESLKENKQHQFQDQLCSSETKMSFNESQNDLSSEEKSETECVEKTTVAKIGTEFKQLNDELKVDPLEKRRYSQSGKRLDSSIRPKGNLSNYGEVEGKDSTPQDLDQSRVHTLSLSDKRKFFEERIKFKSKNQERKFNRNVINDCKKIVNYVDKKLVVSLTRIDKGILSQQLSSPKHKSISLTEKELSEVLEAERNSPEIRNSVKDSNYGITDKESHKDSERKCSYEVSKTMNNSKEQKDPGDIKIIKSSERKSISAVKLSSKRAGKTKSPEDLETSDALREVGITDVTESKNKKDRDPPEVVEKNSSEDTKFSCVEKRKDSNKNMLSRVTERNDKKRKVYENVDSNISRERVFSGVKENDKVKEKTTGVQKKDKIKERHVQENGKVKERRMSCDHENDIVKERKMSGVKKYGIVNERRMSGVKENDKVKESNKSGLQEKDNVKERRTSCIQENDEIKERRMSGVKENHNVKERSKSGLQQNDNVKEGCISCTKENDKVKERRMSSAQQNDKVKESNMSCVLKNDKIERKMSGVQENDNVKEGGMSGVQENDKVKERNMSGVHTNDKVKDRIMSDVQENDNAKDSRMSGVHENDKVKEKVMSGVQKIDEVKGRHVTRQENDKVIEGRKYCVKENNYVKERKMSRSQENDNLKERKISGLQENYKETERKISCLQENYKETERKISCLKENDKVKEMNMSWVQTNDKEMERNISDVQKNDKVKERRMSEVQENDKVKERNVSGVQANDKVKERNVSGVQANDKEIERKMTGVQENHKVKERKMSGVHEKEKVKERMSIFEENEKLKERKVSGVRENDRVKERRKSVVQENDKVKERSTICTQENDKVKEKNMSGVQGNDKVKERKMSSVQKNNRVRERKMSGDQENNNVKESMSDVQENDKVKKRKMSGFQGNDKVNEKRMSGVQENGKVKGSKVFGVQANDKTKERNKSCSQGKEEVKEKGSSSCVQENDTLLFFVEETGKRRENKMSEGKGSNDKDRVSFGVVEGINLHGKVSKNLDINDNLKERNLSDDPENNNEVRFSESESNNCREKSTSDVKERNELEENILFKDEEIKTFIRKDATKTVKCNNVRERSYSGNEETNSLKERRLSVGSKDSGERNRSEILEYRKTRERRLSGNVENGKDSNFKELRLSETESNNAKERRVPYFMKCNNNSRERRPSGVVENIKSKERRHSDISDHLNTRKRHGSESASPLIIKGTTNRPSYGVYIPLGRPTEKHKPFKPVTNPPITDLRSPVSQKEPVKEKETDVIAVDKGKDNESVSEEPVRKIMLGDTTNIEPKRSLFGKNKRRISHYSDKDENSSKTSHDNQRKLSRSSLKESPAKKMKISDDNSDRVQSKLVSPMPKDSPAKRTKLGHENQTKPLSTFQKQSPTNNRSKHPFKTFPINRCPKFSPAKQVKDMDLQKKSANSYDYLNKTSKTENNPTDNIFEKLKENTLESDRENKANDGQNKPVLKRTHDNTNDKSDKRRKHDETITENATKGSILDSVKDTNNLNSTTSVMDNNHYDGKVKEKRLSQEKPYSRIKSSKRKVKGYLPYNKHKSSPKAFKTVQKEPNIIQHSSLNDYKAESQKEKKIDMKNATNVCNEREAFKITQERELKHDKSESKLINFENFNNAVKEVPQVRETTGSSESGMQEQKSENNSIDYKISEAEKSIDIDDALVVSGLESENEIQTEMNFDDKVPQGANMINAKVKRLFKDKHRKNILQESNLNKDISKEELDKMQSNENKSSETKPLKDSTAKSPFREKSKKTFKEFLEDLIDDTYIKISNKIEADKSIPNIINEDCYKSEYLFGQSAEYNRKVGNNKRFIGERNDSGTCIEEIEDAEIREWGLKANEHNVVFDQIENSDFSCETEDNEIDKRKDGKTCEMIRKKRETKNKDRGPDKDGIESIKMKKGSISLTDIFTEENEESIVFNPQIDGESKACHRIKFIDDFVIIHNCVKHDLSGNGYENEFDGKDTSVMKERYRENRCAVEENVICDLILGISTKDEVDGHYDVCEDVIRFNETDASNENTSSVPNRPMKSTPRKKFASQLDTLGKKIEEENKNEQTKTSKIKEKIRQTQRLKLQKESNTEQELDDNDDDADLISSVIKLTPFKEVHVSHTKTTEWLKKAKSNVKIPTRLKTQKALEQEFDVVNVCNSSITKEIETTVSLNVQNCEKNKETQTPSTQFFQPWNETKTTKNDYSVGNTVPQITQTPDVQELVLINPLVHQTQQNKQSDMQEPLGQTVQQDTSTDKLLEQPEVCQQSSFIEEGNTLSKVSEEDICTYSASTHQSNYTCMTDQKGNVPLSVQNVSIVPMFNQLTAKLMKQSYPLEINDEHTHVKYQSEQPVVNNDLTAVRFNMSPPKDIHQIVHETPFQLENGNIITENPCMAFGQIEIPDVQKPVNANSKLRETAKEQDSSLNIGSAIQRSESAKVVTEAEHRRIALYRELCALDNINTGDVGLDVILLAEKSYLRGMMLINKEVLRHAEALCEKKIKYGQQQQISQLCKEKLSMEERVNYLGMLKKGQR